MALRVQDITPSEDLAATEAGFARLRAGGAGVAAMEKRYRHRDGHIIWVEINSTLVRDAAGRPLHVINQTQDITARKQTEEALRASEERLQTLVSNLPVILFALDADGIFTLPGGPGARSGGRCAGRADRSLCPGYLRGQCPRSWHPSIAPLTASQSPSLRISGAWPWTPASCPSAMVRAS